MSMIDMVNLRGMWVRKRRVGESVLFDSAWYKANNPDVAASGMEAFAHYTSVGWSEGRKAHPLFDTEWYLLTYPDVEQSGCNPLQHYVTFGWREGPCRWCADMRQCAHLIGGGMRINTLAILRVALAAPSCGVVREA